MQVDQSIDYAVSRKAATSRLIGLEPDERVLKIDGLKYREAINSAYFHGLILDFDGTTIPAGMRKGAIPPNVSSLLTDLAQNDIPICFATGRGDSINAFLKSAIPSRFHDKIYIAYYNGAFVLPLIEESAFEEKCPKFQNLLTVERLLTELTDFSDTCEWKNKRCQITLIPRHANYIEHVFTKAVWAVAQSAASDLQVVRSTHSIDIIPKIVTKRNAITYMATRNQAPCLAIGDQGAHPGNDFELLQHHFSLSVDTVSERADSCWNFLPQGIYNDAGLVFYGQQMRIRPGSFQLILTQ